MKLAVLYSGGKDSTYAMYKASKQHEIICLITIVSQNPDSYMFHTSNIHLTDLQAQALQLPLIKFNTHGKKELELEDLEQSIKQVKEKFQIQGIVTGALHSNYQASRIQKICDKLDLKCINPLWKMNQEQELKELLNNNFKFILTLIAADGLNRDWLGKEITQRDIDKLTKLEVNPAGEGGEFESLVLDCPLFKKKLKITKSEIKMENKYTGKLIIKNASLID